jgi:anti-sigma regulatory factor (Ser/Thr protein kinase)
MAERFLAVSTAPDEVARARQWARGQAAGFAWPTRWHPDSAAVALVVSELVTNALRYAGGVVGLTMIFDARRLRIMVSDDSRVQPVLHPTAAGGHGLVVVERLTAAWGVVTYRTGKQVWADLAAPGASPALAPSGHTAFGAPGSGQKCLSCAAPADGDEPGALVASPRWRTRVVGAYRRAIPPCSRVLRRVCVSAMRRMSPSPRRSAVIYRPSMVR